MRNILGYLARLIMIVIGVFAVVLLVVGVVRFAENRSNYDENEDKSTEIADSDKSGSKSDDNTKDVSTDDITGSSNGADDKGSKNNETTDIISESDTTNKPDSVPSSDAGTTPNTNADEQSPGVTARDLPATRSSLLSINLFIASSLALYAIHLKSKDHYYNLD